MKFKLALVSIIFISANSIYSMTPQEKLFEAAFIGDIALVEEALKEGADVNSKDKDGNIALINASLWGYNEIVEKLIETGSNINLQDNEGDTALMNAARFGYEDIVKKLIKAGADIFIKNKKGETAIDKAVEIGLIKILELLLSHLEQQRKTIEENLPLADVLIQITTEYLGYPKVVKKKKM